MSCIPTSSLQSPCRQIFMFLVSAPTILCASHATIERLVDRHPCGPLPHYITGLVGRELFSLASCSAISSSKVVNVMSTLSSCQFRHPGKPGCRFRQRRSSARGLCGDTRVAGIDLGHQHSICQSKPFGYSKVSKPLSRLVVAKILTRTYRRHTSGQNLGF